MASTSTPGSAAALLPHLFPERKPMTPAQIAAGVEAALVVQRRAVTFGKRPFAAVLLGPDNETVLLTHQSLDQVNHAESSLARLAYTHYTKDFLWQCTLVSTWEPCGMCTATIYWAHIGRIIFAGTNDQLYELTGPGNKENFTSKSFFLLPILFLTAYPYISVDWHTKDFLKGCPQKDVEVIGPLEAEGKVVMEESDKYWSTTRIASR